MPGVEGAHTLEVAQPNAVARAWPVWPYTVRVSCQTTLTGWLAAGYGAITIAAAGDLRATGTAWIFGWPFVLMLVTASSLHLLAVGGGASLGLPRFLSGLRSLNDAARARRDGRVVGRETLAAALDAAPRFPVWDASVAIVLSAFVVVACVVLERAVARVPSPNSWVIFRAGIYAIALYGTATLALGELVIRPICRDLRRQAGAYRLDPYGDFAMPAGWRIATTVVPTAVALLVALEIGTAPGGPGFAAYAALLALTAAVTFGLAFLQQLNRRAAVEELTAGCRNLVAGVDDVIVTGSGESGVVAMAQEFNAAANWVRADRRASNERYRALFEGAPDAIVLADPVTGRVALANARAAELFGRALSELQTERYETLFSASTLARHPIIARPGLRPGETAVVEGTVVRADGSRCPVDIALSTVPVANGRLVQAILHDVSERKRIEEELEAQNEALRSARDRLLAHDRAKTEFLGTVSHELRTPLNVFIGYTEMLLEAGDMPASERVDVLGRLLASGRTLASLVEDTLSVLRLDAATVRLDLDRVALEDLFRELQEADRLLRRSGAVEERWEVEPGLPLLVTDRRKLRQVLTNLVGNARKFTEVGSIVVEAIAGPVSGHVRLTVTDTGCGIPAADLPAIFDAYRQAPSRRASEGCGLGLYIVRRYVELLGGQVECRSTPGVGTAFAIDLPCETSPVSYCEPRE